MLEWVHRLIAGVLRRAAWSWSSPSDLPGAGASARGSPLAGGGLILLLLVQAGARRRSPCSTRTAPGRSPCISATRCWCSPCRCASYVFARLARACRPGRGCFVPAAAGLVLALLAMMSAAMTAKSGASLACSTWPLCNGALVPDLGDAFDPHPLRPPRAGGRDRPCPPVPALAQPRSAGPARGLRRRWRSRPVSCAQIALGGLVILLEAPLWQAVLHQAVGVLTFADCHAVAVALCAGAAVPPSLEIARWVRLRGA